MLRYEFSGAAISTIYLLVGTPYELHQLTCTALIRVLPEDAAL